MDKLIEKFGVFDILASFVPGMVTIILSLLWLLKMHLLDGTICMNLIKKIVEHDMTGMLYILFVCFSYIAGIIVDALRRGISEKVLKDWRCKYPIDAKPMMKKIYLAVFEDVLEHKIEENALICRNEEAETRNKEVCNYCMTALEIHGGISKAERMLVLSEMNGSMALNFLTFTALFLVANIRNGGGLFSWGCNGILCVATIIFYRSYNRFARYRVESIFKSYYFKFIRPIKPDTK